MGGIVSGLTDGLTSLKRQTSNIPVEMHESSQPAQNIGVGVGWGGGG